MVKTLRCSRQRERIFEYPAASKDHPSAEMIYTGLRKDLPELSLWTAYRSRKIPEELGKIQKVTSCQNCGAIIDVFDADAESLFGSIALGNGYHIHQ